ncbi:MAG: SsrA-binding protein SmpB [Armatimonadota bacterium]
MKTINIVNRKAFHEYEMIDTYQAGIVLVGTEVKSIREGNASISEAFCKVENGEMFVYNMRIAPYEEGNRWNTDPLRTRKLLLHKSEINKIKRAVKEKGYTIIPIKLHFIRGYAKLQICTAKGKKLWDKRDAIAKKDVERDKQRQLSEKH